MLQVEVHRLVWFVGILAFSMGILLFVVGVARKIKTLDGAGAGGIVRPWSLQSIGVGDWMYVGHQHAAPPGGNPSA